MSITTAKTLMTDTGNGNKNNTVLGKTVSGSGMSPKTDIASNSSKKVQTVTTKTLHNSAGTGLLDIVQPFGMQAPAYYGIQNTPISKGIERIYNTTAKGIKDGVRVLGDAATGAGLLIDDALNGESSPSKGGGRSGGGYGGSVGSGYGSYQDVMDLVNQTAMNNNEWSANQALLDRQWQEYMSNTAHQREVADLQAAGLNPVLSAGGNGASTPSGAMGQTDTSNTRLIAEIAMEAIAASSQSAGALGSVAKSASKGNILSKVLSSPIAKTVGRSAVSALTRKLVYSLF